MNAVVKNRVTLHHLDPEARSASVDFNVIECGSVPDDELEALLERFRNLDPIENVVAEPDIRIESGGERYVVQTGQKKLLLYNARDRMAPAQVLSPAEAVAEFNGSARAVRATNVLSANEAAVQGRVAPVVVSRIEHAPRRSRAGVLLIVLAVLLAGLAIVAFGGDRESAGGEGILPLPPAELAAAQIAMVGVFMTGNVPGSHGIALDADGRAKLFRLNRIVAPSVALDNFALGRRGPRLAVILAQLGTVIEVVDTDTLAYCGETFRRLP